jgi:hypothetical protein
VNIRIFLGLAIIKWEFMGRLSVIVIVAIYCVEVSIFRAINLHIVKLRFLY